MQEIGPASNISTVIASMAKSIPRSGTTWFRGHSRYRYGLVPTLFRQGEVFGKHMDEAKMYNEFIRRHPEQSNSHKSVVQWLTLMQHYSLPTRLLDWTTNLLVALYFCCKEDTRIDGAVFAMNPEALDSFQINPLLEAEVVATDPADFYRRLLYESGNILNEDARINGRLISEIKQDVSVGVKYTHPATRMEL